MIIIAASSERTFINVECSIEVAVVLSLLSAHELPSTGHRTPSHFWKVLGMQGPGDSPLSPFGCSTAHKP